jgi:hypothetical protein
MRRSARRVLLPLALASAAGLVAAGPASAAAQPKPRPRTVHLTGTAYEFNKVEVRLRGAKIRVAELPGRSATVKADGSYDLVVPARATVTPYIVAKGYHTIYLQTFTTRGRDLRNVNFQTPTDAVTAALGTLLNIPLNADGYPVQCAIVSTFSTRQIDGLDFAGFVAYGAHGVAGASATTTPTLPAPVYFNEQVVPDPAQQLSSIDGGVVWPVVPAGTYRIRASAPGSRFAAITATCAPGRIVNANPPWGLHQL